MEILERWDTKQESEGEKELVDTNGLIECWVVQEHVPFRGAIGKWLDVGGSIRSVDNKDDGGGAQSQR
jgi:hypothetical protein